VALDLLGPDYRWRTSVYADKQPDASGVVDGNLTNVRQGRSGFGQQAGARVLADQLYQRGVRQVRGNIIGDNSYFSGELYGLGWQWNDLQWYFGAEPSALTINENSVELTISPAKKSRRQRDAYSEPRSQLSSLVNHTATAERDATTTIGIKPRLSDKELVVWGDFPVNGRAFKCVLCLCLDLHCGRATLFREALIARGSKSKVKRALGTLAWPKATNSIRRKPSRLARRIAPPSPRSFVTQTRPATISYAELILRTLGKERGATCAGSRRAQESRPRR